MPRIESTLRALGACLALAVCALPSAADDAFVITQDLRFVRVSAWVTETQSPFGQDFQDGELNALPGQPFDEQLAANATFFEGEAASAAQQTSAILPASIVASGQASVSGEALCCVLESSAVASSVVDVSFELREPRDFRFQGSVQGVQTFLLRDGVPVFNEVVGELPQALELSGHLPADRYQLVVRAAIGVFASGDPVSDHGAFDVAFELEPETSAWTDLGQGLAGSFGVPSLELEGSLAAGAPLALTLSGALPNTSATLVLGLDALEAPFKGGVMVPVPSVLLSNLVTNAGAELALATNWVNPSPSGVSLYLQVWLVDPGAVLGFAASNAIRGDVP